MTSPIIFVPGTSGSFLLTPEAFTYTSPSDTHIFTDGTLKHESRSFQYPVASDIWMGPATVDAFLSDTFTVTDTLTLNVNRGNHYLDVLRFNASGVQGSGTPMSLIGEGGAIDVVHTGILSGPLEITIPVYSSFLQFLHNYDTSGVYIYAYDWRADLQQQAQGLSDLIGQVKLETGANQVILIAHSLGGLVCRAFYLASQQNASQVEKVITMGTGFAGIPLGIKALLAGDTWGIGFNLSNLLGNLAPSWLEVGLAEWEVQSIAQNWPTSYYQSPNADDWFSDDQSNNGKFDRTYIRDFRSNTATPLVTYNENMAWLQQEGLAQAALGLAGLNVGLVGSVQSFYNSLFTSMGNFLQGTPVPHYRIISRGIDTVAGVKVSYAPSYLASFSSNSPVPNPVTAPEYQLYVTHEPYHCDGDNTVPYHGALGLTDPHDPSVFVTTNIAHVGIPEDANVQTLVGCLIAGDMTNCAGIQGKFSTPTNAPETVY